VPVDPSIHRTANLSLLEKWQGTQILDENSLVDKILNSHAANGFTDAPMSKAKNKNLHHSVIKDMIKGIFEPFLEQQDD
jgi:hypothetical protein